jgi:putative membrane protein
MFGWGMMIIGGLVMLLFWSIVIALAVWAIRALTRSEQGRGEGKSLALHENNALEILKQRYARGEISREEYQDMRRDLES